MLHSLPGTPNVNFKLNFNYIEKIALTVMIYANTSSLYDGTLLCDGSKK